MKELEVLDDSTAACLLRLGKRLRSSTGSRFAHGIGPVVQVDGRCLMVVARAVGKVGICESVTVKYYDRVIW